MHINMHMERIWGFNSCEDCV